MDKSMSKILTNLHYYGPISNKKGLNIDPINPQIFEFLPYVHFFKDFHYKTFRDFLCFLITLTRSIFELEKYSFFLNKSEFRQKLIGNVIRVLVQHQTFIGDPCEVKCHIRAQCAPFLNKST